MTIARFPAFCATRHGFQESAKDSAQAFSAQRRKKSAALKYNKMRGGGSRSNADRCYRSRRARYNACDVDVNGTRPRFHAARGATFHHSKSAHPMPTYTITELAREFDITARAIRFYEDQGLLSPTREGAGGRNRVYTPRDRTRLKLTLRGKRLGLALSEIKSLVDMYESPKDTSAQMHRFLGVLAQHRETLEQQREDIAVALAEIGAHEEECRRMLAEVDKP